MRRAAVTSAIAIAASLAAATPALAHHSGHHSHAYRGVVIGAVPVFGLPYYNPAGLIYVVPTPVYSAPWPGECRVFQGNAVVAGSGLPFAGTACWQPDGRWHVVGG